MVLTEIETMLTSDQTILKDVTGQVKPGETVWICSINLRARTAELTGKDACPWTSWFRMHIAFARSLQ